MLIFATSDVSSLLWHDYPTTLKYCSHSLCIFTKVSARKAKTKLGVVHYDAITYTCYNLHSAQNSQYNVFSLSLLKPVVNH